MMMMMMRVISSVYDDRLKFQWFAYTGLLGSYEEAERGLSDVLLYHCCCCSLLGNIFTGSSLVAFSNEYLHPLQAYYSTFSSNHSRKPTGPSRTHRGSLER